MQHSQSAVCKVRIQKQTPKYTHKVHGVFIMHKNELNEHERYMLRAVELAGRGEGHVDPNPLVGAVIVKDGRIIGEGWHEVYGSLHAERNALKNCTEDPKGTDMYVTLEPCCHHGKQPPCTEAIIEAGIRHVYVGSADPNPLVAGKGIAQLKEAGIEVTEGVMRAECDALNPVFFHYISTGEPYTALKYAMSADGRIACDSGRSQWITGAEAREHVHKLRNRYKGILVGIGTVLADDPMLTCRIEGERNPVRIVLDTGLRIPIDSRLVQSAAEIPLIVICGRSECDNAGAEHPGCRAFTDGAENGIKNIKDKSIDNRIILSEKIKALKEHGAEIIEVGIHDGHVDICEALKELGARGINGILIEGGAEINSSFIKAGKVNHVYAYIGAEILGGSICRNPVRGFGFDAPEQALKLKKPEIMSFGRDVLLSFDIDAGDINGV